MSSIRPSNDPRGSRKEIPKVIAVAGAKGGVGKTTIAVNVALCLAAMGRKVVLVDADRLGGNVHTLLGLTRAPGASGNSESGGTQSLDGVDGLYAAETLYPDLHVAYSDVDRYLEGLKNLARYSALTKHIRALEADHVVIDLGEGMDRALVELFFEADQGLYVTTPDPSAIENVQRFLRVSFWHRLKRVQPERGSSKAWSQRLRKLAGVPAPNELLQRLEAENDPLVPYTRKILESFRLHLVVNQTRVRQDLQLGEGLAIASQRRLGLRVDCLGHVSYDEAAWLCMRKRRPLMVESPGSKAGRGIEKLVRRLLTLDRTAAPYDAAPVDSYFGLLGVGRGATDEEIRRACKRMKEIYSPDSLASYGLFDSDELQHLRGQIDEAYEVLLNPSRRSVYEQTLFPAHRAPEVSLAEESKPNIDALALFPEIGPDTQYNGALLRAIREAQGVDLAYIARHTKIGISYLKAIEEDDFGALPEKVYVRGYVAEFAKVLRLDAKHVSRTYMRILERHRQATSAA